MAVCRLVAHDEAEPPRVRGDPGALRRAAERSIARSRRRRRDVGREPGLVLAEAGAGALQVGRLAPERVHIAVVRAGLRVERADALFSPIAPTPSFCAAATSAVRASAAAGAADRRPCAACRRARRRCPLDSIGFRGRCLSTTSHSRTGSARSRTALRRSPPGLGTLPPRRTRRSRRHPIPASGPSSPPGRRTLLRRPPPRIGPGSEGRRRGTGSTRVCGIRGRRPATLAEGDGGGDGGRAHRRDGDDQCRRVGDKARCRARTAGGADGAGRDRPAVGRSARRASLPRAGVASDAVSARIACTLTLGAERASRRQRLGRDHPPILTCAPVTPP
jgi:hypothetical protein